MTSPDYRPAHPARRALATALFCSAAGVAAAAERGSPRMGEAPKVTVKVVEGGESHRPANKCRKMIVGPGVNQPDPFPGYLGFVGWECPVRLRDGTMLVCFSAGYWHASPPTPPNPGPDYMAAWHKRCGCPPDFRAPTGGRAMVCKSTDDGITWSKPKTLLDTPCDDRHPAMIELSDGTLVCSLFMYTERWKEDSVHPDPLKRIGTVVVRSLDGGKTWESAPRHMPAEPFPGGGSDGPPLELPDKSVLLAAYGMLEKVGHEVIAVYRSTDRGTTWELLSSVVTDYEQSEPTLARLKDGRLVMISRPEGAITWSSDEGKTWTTPVRFGFRIYAPTLLVLDDGTLLCHFGDYKGGNLRAIFSTDGGKTWIAPAKDHGFLIDRTYGYSRSCLMPDGSAYLAYIATAGIHAPNARNNAIWSIKLRVRPDHSGIELLPVESSTRGKVPEGQSLNVIPIRTTASGARRPGIAFCRASAIHWLLRHDGAGAGVLVGHKHSRGNSQRSEASHERARIQDRSPGRGARRPS